MVGHVCASPCNLTKEGTHMLQHMMRLLFFLPSRVFSSFFHSLCTGFSCVWNVQRLWTRLGFYATPMPRLCPRCDPIASSIFLSNPPSSRSSVATADARLTFNMEQVCFLPFAYLPQGRDTTWGVPALSSSCFFSLLVCSGRFPVPFLLSLRVKASTYHKSGALSPVVKLASGSAHVAC